MKYRSVHPRQMGLSVYIKMTFGFCRCLMPLFNLICCLTWNVVCFIREGYQSLGLSSSVLWWHSSRCLMYLFSGQYFYSTGWCCFSSRWGNRYNTWSNTDMSLSLSGKRCVFLFSSQNWLYPLNKLSNSFLTASSVCFFLAAVWKETGSNREQWMINQTVHVSNFKSFERSSSLKAVFCFLLIA